MRTKHTTENAGGASAAVDFASAVDKAEDLASKMSDAFCAAKLMEERLGEVLYPGIRHSKDDGFFYLGSIDKKILGFVSNEIVTRTEALDDLADDLFETLNQMRGKLEQHKPVDKPRASHSTGLEAAISEWKSAYDAWIATEANGAIPEDTPEAAAEQKALLALASYPCLSLEDVHAKTNLFLRWEYLSDLASEYTLNLIRSFSGSKGDL